MAGVGIVITNKGRGCDYIQRQPMKSSIVGIREAKIHLSKLLKLVKAGGEVILTERGQPVGKILPIDAEKLPLAKLSLLRTL
jgi:prevent-host-death family protein